MRLIKLLIICLFISTSLAVKELERSGFNDFVTPKLPPVSDRKLPHIIILDYFRSFTPMVLVQPNRLGCFFSIPDELRNVINTIPKNDLKEIKSLFRYLFDTNGFSYSLYGDKPLSFSDASLSRYSCAEMLNFLSLDKCCESFLEIYSEPSGFLKKRWETWLKYKHLFKIKKYFLFEKSYRNQVRIFFINKEKLNYILNKNINLFKKKINQNVNSGILFKEIASANTDIFEALHNNEGLLGILLGFGKHNSMLFQKKQELTKAIGKTLEPSALIQKKIKCINNKLQPLHEYDSHIIATINRIGFAADPHHQETIQLKNKYDELNKKINEIYAKNDWFEQTLIQLTSDFSD